MSRILRERMMLFGSPSRGAMAFVHMTRHETVTKPAASGKTETPETVIAAALAPVTVSPEIVWCSAEAYNRFAASTGRKLLETNAVRESDSPAEVTA